MAEKLNETERRRKIIRDLMLKRGITNRAEIRRILINEFDLKPVTRQTIYKDIHALARLTSSKIEEFELDIISVYRKMIFDMLTEINNCDDAKDRSSMRKTLSQLIKDQHSVANAIALRGTPGEVSKKPKEREDSPPKRIVFGDPEVEE